jgi:purine-binding chemotaxis protein CheW
MSEAALELVQQYLTFGLGNETFAVDVAKAREVIDDINITAVPQTPEYMLGVINLRGRVVPVIDMRMKFGMDKAEQTVDSCIIVLEVDVDGDVIVVGALADSVREVLDINPDQIEPPPRLGTKLNTEFIHGMGNCNDEFVIILDIDKVFSVEELNLVQEVSAENETE